MSLTVESRYARWSVGDDARTIEFVDPATGRNHAAGGPCARARLADGWHDAASAERVGDRVRIGFGACGACAELDIRAERRWLSVSVDAASEGIEELEFCRVPLHGEPGGDGSFSVCALALNLLTNVPELPGPNRLLRALCHRQIGLRGARTALVSGTGAAFRDCIKAVVSAAPDLPRSTFGGPWALDGQSGRRSYLFNFSDLTEETVEDWLRLMKAFGIGQMDFHGGRSFRFGDCEPNPAMYPRGLDSLASVVKRMHAFGVAAGLHTYAFFLAKDCRWVSPVPDPRLACAGTYTLAAPVGAGDGRVPVLEPLDGVSAVTGFFVRNSVTLQVGDELIVFSGVEAGSAPGFTGCRRGAHGTRAAAHAAGSPVRHLKECFGLFAPDGDSSLFTEVAARTAEVINHCRFDMMYLDALDGEDLFAGREFGWHYGSKFVFEVWKRLHEPVIAEMSTFHHHLWYVRSRIGAWDHPSRGHKAFIDHHVAANRRAERMMLPTHLGWWALLPWTEPGNQVERVFADDVEYLCARAAATDSGCSFMGVTPALLDGNPMVRRLAAVSRRWEHFRRKGAGLSADVRRWLGEPGSEFRLDGGRQEPWQLRRAWYERHKIERMEAGQPERWTVRNPHGQQPAWLRIEALPSVRPAREPGEVVLGSAGLEWARTASPGVEWETCESAAATPDGEAALRIRAHRTERIMPVATAEQADDVLYEHGLAEPSADPPGWLELRRVFEPSLNLRDRPGLAAWVHGDGSGSILNFQLRSPMAVSGGAADHFVILDFSGWRLVELVESEGERHRLCSWPYGRSLYGLYREPVDFARVESFSIWLNRLPELRPAECAVGPIRAAGLAAQPLRSPEIRIGAHALRLDGVSIPTGGFLEWDPGDRAQIYGADGGMVSEWEPVGDRPILDAGENAVVFTCGAGGAMATRARVTLGAFGDRLEL